MVIFVLFVPILLRLPLHMGEDGRTIALDMLIEPDAPGSNARSCDDCGSGIDSRSGRSASAQPSVPSGYQTTSAYPMARMFRIRETKVLVSGEARVATRSKKTSKDATFNTRSLAMNRSSQ